MSNIIDRQAAIDAIKSYWRSEVDTIPKDADFGTVTATCDLILKCNAAICEVLQDLPSAQPEIPPYVAEIEAEYKKWVNVPYIRKPLAKALYEVWKKHDREDVERRTDDEG